MTDSKPTGAPPPLRWEGTPKGDEGHLVVLDQTRLPGEVVEDAVADPQGVVEAIRSMRVRGAPAIGIAGAFGVALGAVRSRGAAGEAVCHDAQAAAARLARSRPTARNLFWALQRMRERIDGLHAASPVEVRRALIAEALAILDEEVARCRAIGKRGAALLPDVATVLTHCNAGALATGGFGTALGVVFAAREMGKRVRVFACETRPLLQGARLTAFELASAHIECTVLCDSMVGALLGRSEVDLVIVGADRIARNGDVANKIGTYTISVLAKEHGVPLYVAAPTSTFDRGIATGAEIPIEERAPEEVLSFAGVRTAPAGVKAWNPAFDVTPARNVRAIVTERGVIERPDEAKIMRHLDEIAAPVRPGAGAETDLERQRRTTGGRG